MKIPQLKNFRFKKQLGQNFITDENFLRAITADSGIDKNDVVIEVGAGAGTLTAALANAAKSVIAYEIDKDLAPVLAQTLAGFDNIELRFEDILRTKSGTPPSYKVVANLPYYITAPIIMHFLEAQNPPESMTIMMQKEVAERLTAAPSTPEYGAFTLQVALYGEAKIVRAAPRSLFFPQPNVDSTVVRIDVNPKFNAEQTAQLKRLIKSAFSMRRKTLVNNLTAAGMQKGRILSALSSLNLPPAIRGEALNLRQFSVISDSL